MNEKRKRTKCPVFSVFRIDTDYNIRDNRSKVVYYREINNENLILLKTALLDVNWDLVINTDDANVAFENFISIFRALYDKYIPLVKKSVKLHTDRKPFINDDIKSKIRQKNKLAKLYARYPITYEREFKLFRNALNNEIKYAKKNYYSKKLNECSCDVGGTWKVLNSILKRKK